MARQIIIDDEDFDIVVELTPDQVAERQAQRLDLLDQRDATIKAARKAVAPHQAQAQVIGRQLAKCQAELDTGTCRMRIKGRREYDAEAGTVTIVRTDTDGAPVEVETRPATKHERDLAEYLANEAEIEAARLRERDRLRAEAAARLAAGGTVDNGTAAEA